MFAASLRVRYLAIALPTMFLGALLAAGCNQAPPPAPAKVIDVVATQPVKGEVTDYQDFTGRLEAVKMVEIRSRVSGYLKRISFKEGDLVHEGDMLYLIDPRPFEADLKQALANLKVAEADRKLQEKNTERARVLYGRNAIGKEEYDQIQANWEKSEATIGAMEAARDRASIYVDFTKVTAPVTGRISRENVNLGNLIVADNTILTTIVTVDPVYAYFDVDERTYLDLVKATGRGANSWSADLQFPVLMALANEDKDNPAHAGTVNFLDNRLNANTGTIRMRGVFKNDNGILKPGLFVRIRLPIGVPFKAILVSDEALLNDQGRKYAYVVNDQDEVEYRSVKVGQAIQGLRVILEGLAEGERVIVSGMQRVRPKSKVQVKMQAPPTPPESSLGKLLTANRQAATPPRTAAVH